MYDVAIIGAGPAGATFARLIGDRYKTLLADKRSFKDISDSFPQGKCCGGLLAPDAQKMLSRLGLGLPKSVLEEPQLFVVKAIDMGAGLERHYQRHYININRQKFDNWLLSLVPSGVDIRTDCRLKSFDKEQDFFRLLCSRHGKTYVEKAKILVGADGAVSKVRRGAATGRAFPGKYIAIQEWVEGDRNFPYFTSIFDPEITDYYCWTIPKKDHLIVGGAFHPRQNVSAKFSLLKNRLTSYGFKIGKTVWKEGAFILRPVRVNQLAAGEDRIALLGEAGGWISPSSAEGLSYAFRSALMMAESIRESPEGFIKRYQEKTRELRRNIFFKNMKSRFVFGQNLRRVIMRSGIQSMNMYRP